MLPKSLLKSTANQTVFCNGKDIVLYFKTKKQKAIVLENPPESCHSIFNQKVRV